MSVFDQTLKQEILNQIFRGSAAPALTGPFVVSLHTAAPGTTRANEVSTAVWTNYARATIARSTAQFDAAGNGGGDLEKTANTALVDFGTPTIVGGDGSNNQITHVEVWDSSVTPRRVWGKALSTAKVIQNGDPVDIPAGALVPTLDG